MLQKGDLLFLADRFKIRPSDRRAKASIIEALTAAQSATVGQMLASLPRSRLKELCRQRGLADGGKEKIVIVTRLLGGDVLNVAWQERATQPSSGVDAAASDPYPKARKGKIKREAAPKTKTKRENGAILGFETKLWDAADLLTLGTINGLSQVSHMWYYVNHCAPIPTSASQRAPCGGTHKELNWGANWAVDAHGLRKRRLIRSRSEPPHSPRTPKSRFVLRSSRP